MRTMSSGHCVPNAGQRPYTKGMSYSSKLRSMTGLRSIAGSAALVSSSFLALAAVPATLATQAAAQQRGTAQRVVQGKVTDAASAALKGAIVYLKDGHTLSVKSFIADDGGEYR